MAVEQLTIGQVAARYDVSTDAVRRRIRRGLLPARRDNHGQWWIELDPGAPPPATLAPPRSLQSAGLAPALRAMQPPPLALPSAEWADLRERAAAAEGEARGLREALHVAKDAAAEATRRAETAERAAVEAWERVAELARHFAALQAPAMPAGPPPLPPRRKGLLARLVSL